MRLTTQYNHFDPSRSNIVFYVLKTRLDKTKTTRHGKARLGKARHGTTKHGKTRQGKTRQENRRQDNPRQEIMGWNACERTRTSAHGELMVVRVASLTTVGVDRSIGKGKLWNIGRSEDDAVLRTNECSHSRVFDRGISTHEAIKTHDL
jgi:hypothetical protein